LFQLVRLELKQEDQNLAQPLWGYRQRHLCKR